jgi:hypothetical protein
MQVHGRLRNASPRQRTSPMPILRLLPDGSRIRPGLRHLFPVADLPWGIFTSRSFIARHGRPAGAGDLVRFTVVELIDELESVPAAPWMSAHAVGATLRRAAECAERSAGSEGGRLSRPATSHSCSNRRRARVRVGAAADAHLSNVPLGTQGLAKRPSCCSPLLPSRAKAGAAHGQDEKPSPAECRLTHS